MFTLLCWSVLLLCHGGMLGASALKLKDSKLSDEKAMEISSTIDQHTVKFSNNMPLASEQSWPCPVPEIIAPCTCESKEENYEVNIDCSLANSESEIKTAFSSIFPFDDVTYFTIDNEENVNNISQLTEGVFDVKTFVSVEISGTTLSTIEDNTLVYSHPTLLSLGLNNNNLQSFPFETIQLYEKLISLNLNNNQFKEIPQFSSSTLRVLSMNSNENLEFQQTTDTFCTAPELRQLYLANIGLKVLNPGMFNCLEHITDIYLSNNYLVELDECTFCNPNPSLDTLYLANNMISTVHGGAITGLSSQGILDLSYNDITVLDEAVWEPIFKQVLDAGEIVLDGNPLLCGCDFLWIVNNDNYWALISSGSTCYAGIAVSDIDKDFIVQNCP